MKLIDIIKEIAEEKAKGLYYYMNKKKKEGRKPSHGNSKAHKSAVKAAKEINKNK
jgi:hypothetical protein